MSEAQALETEEQAVLADEVIVEDESLAGDESQPEPEEVEIVLEGEEEPPSVPLPQMKKRLGRAKRQVEAANSEADEAKKRAAMLEEEVKLLRMSKTQGKPDVRPNENDFDTHDEFKAAEDKWLQAQIKEAARKEAQELLETTHTQNTQAQVEANLGKQIDAHYERSAKLKVPDYEAVEEVAVNILGDDIARQIVANTEDSHLLMYHLGKNPARAEQLKQLLLAQPLKGAMEIGGIAKGLKARPKSSAAPNPETVVEGGARQNEFKVPAGVKIE